MYHNFLFVEKTFEKSFLVLYNDRERSTLLTPGTLTITEANKRTQKFTKND